MTPPADTKRYKHHRFPGAIISHGVWLSSRFTLSDRDVQELLFERGITVSHEAIRPWCHKFGQGYANQRRHRRPQPGDTWHVEIVFTQLTKTRGLAARVGGDSVADFDFSIGHDDTIDQQRNQLALLLECCTV